MRLRNVPSTPTLDRLSRYIAPSGCECMTFSRSVSSRAVTWLPRLRPEPSATVRPRVDTSSLRPGPQLLESFGRAAQNKRDFGPYFSSGNEFAISAAAAVVTPAWAA